MATVQALGAATPNLGGGKASTARQLSPLDVSHTFTVLVKKAGSYRWQCFDPCGSGPSGFGGVMAEPGYMCGTLMVTA